MANIGDRISYSENHVATDIRGKEGTIVGRRGNFWLVEMDDGSHPTDGWLSENNEFIVLTIKSSKLSKAITQIYEEKRNEL